jgi:hypothetical protein
VLYHGATGADEAFAGTPKSGFQRIALAKKRSWITGSKMTKDKAIQALQHAAFDARDVGLNEEQIIEAVKAPTTEYQAELDACSGKSLNLGK